MNITWLGHACFLLEQDGYKLLLDPYTGVPGYPPLTVAAHQTLCSHHHFDHDYLAAVQTLPAAPSPFVLRTVETWHDDRGGALRGPNTIHILTAGGVTVAHLGDLGHPLSETQLAAIGPVDVALVPVGGVYTVDAAGAKAVCQALGPRCVVPMHYHHAPCGLPDLAGVEDFLALWPAQSVRRLLGNTLTPDPDMCGVLVPRFSAE